MMSIRPISERWAQLADRERRLVVIAITLVAVAALWWLGLAPALTSLRSADARHRQIDTQLQQMHALQTQAKTLQAQPRLSYDETLRALETSVKQGLGPTARLQVAGERATVTLKGISAETLAQWLAQARVNARATPSEAHLMRNAAVSAPGAAAGGATWDGTLVMRLPTR